jgi:hypothetical protein
MSQRRPTTEQELIEQIRAIDVPAPESLHRQVEAMIASRSRRGARRRGPAGVRRERSFSLAPRIAAGGAIALAALALVLSVSLSGSSSQLSVHDASALTLSPATSGAPAESSSHEKQLAANVEGVAFPYWGKRFGWHATGTRRDHLDGRNVTTVFYENARGRRVGYAIVAGGAPSGISGGVVTRHDGTPYRLLTIRGAAVVTWERDGHLCVISGHHVSGAMLLRMAEWDEPRSQAS